MNSLPDEIKYKILSYVPKSWLKKHFDDPVVGSWCKARYYSTIKIDILDIQENEADDLRLGEEVGDVMSTRRAHDMFVPEYRPPHFSGVGFYVFEFFLDLVRANSEIDFNRLEINSIKLFLRLARDHPEVLAAMKQIELSFSFFDFDTADYRSYDRFCNLVQEVARDADKVGIPLTVTEMNFYFPFKIQDRELALEYSQFMPATVDLSRLTALCIANTAVVDLEQLLARTTGLREISFRALPIYDHQLQYLPRGLKRLFLLSSLRLTETHVRLQLPESLQFFKVATTTCLGDDSIPVTLDMSHLHQLIGVSVNSCHIRSLEDLKLPWTLRYLNVGYCPELRDLKSLHLFKQLVSFACDGCYRLMGLPAVFGESQFPPALQYYQLSHYVPFNQIETVQPTPKEWETFYVVETQGDVKRQYLKLDSRTVWPNSVRRILINNPKLVLDGSHRFPDSLTKLTLEAVHNVLDIQNLVLPKQLQELRLFRLKIDSLDGLQFPESLKTFEAVSCNISSLKGTNLRSLPDLEVLVLSWNALDDSSEVFKELPASLRDLTIIGNPITKVDVSGCPRLKELSIEHCNLKSISQETLKLPDSLERLKADFNSLKHISDSFEFPTNLKRLSLFKHDIKIDEAFFARLPAGLEDLNTSGDKAEPYEVAQLKFPRSLKVLRFDHPLDLVESPNFTDQCPGLESLYFAVHTYPRLDFRSYPTGLWYAGVSAEVYGEVVGDIDHLEKMTIFTMANWKTNYHRLTIPVNTQNLYLTRSDIENLGDRIDYSKCKSLVHLSLVENESLDVDALVETAKRLKSVCPMFTAMTISEELATEGPIEQMRAFGVKLEEP